MLPAGTVVADRFVIEAPIGVGGMGRVYRATDRRTGREVAVKVMLEADLASPDAARFEREVAVLADLAHPGIVAYIAHGTTDDGRPFLAMELLEGEDLGERLARAPLSIDESLKIVQRVAEALVEPHRRGIVHRDLKPTNLFLRGGAPGDVAVLDFGIARRPGAGRSLTATGSIVGTPDYMAPEQARGEREIGQSADVFALGCVLYECLAGRPPFSGEHVIATLTKILFEEPPPLASLRPEIPEAVCALVSRMIEKTPERRFRDAGELSAALSCLGSPGGATVAAPPLTPGLGGKELELVSVIIATLPGAWGADATVDDAAADDADRAADAVKPALAQRGVSVERLPGGSLVATLVQRGDSAVDLAVEAASCARIVQASWPAAVVAVATARRVAGVRVPVGEAIERAGALLSRAMPRPPASPSGAILLDDVTAALLHGRVRTHRIDRVGITLHDDPVSVDETRLLLGKPTPCVGREQELGMLEATLASSFEEGASRAVLVVAPPGLGKSRLRHEFLRRVDQRAAGDGPPVLRIEGRGELLRAGSPYAVLGQALRRLFGIGPACGVAEAREKVLAGTARHVPAADARDAAEMLGELCDAPFPDDDSVKLRAARQDGRLMQARISHAFVALLRGIAGRHGVLVVLEDMQWGDRASLDLAALALRELEDRPLLVVAFARPEIHELFPDLWRGRVIELPLRPLGRRACERLVAKVAGDRLDAATAARIVEQSAGNALFLEELLRTACEGESGALPETVLAMLQARIGRLETAERRVLRAASIFGERFGADGLSALLGPPPQADDLARLLAELTRGEILEAQRDEPGVHRFRHALMRDAAYGLLTDEDRRLGHRLAAAYYAERAPDPAVVAEHYLLGEDRAQAIPWLVAATERAHAREQYAAVTRLVDRGRSSGASGEALGALAALEASARRWQWDWSKASACAAEALTLVPGGSAHWCMATSVLATVAAYRNDVPALRDAVDRFLSTPPPPEARLVHAEAALQIASAAAQVGLTGPARSLLLRVERTIGDDLPRYPSISASLHMIRCTYLRHTDDELAPQLELLREAVRLLESVGALESMLVLSRDVLGETSCRAGQIEEGEATLRASHADAVRIGGMFLSHARLALANALSTRAEPAARDEAEALARELLDTPGISAGYRAMANDVLAATRAAAGDLAAAEEAAREAISLSPHTPVRRWLMVAHLAHALTGLGRAAEARERAAEAVAEMDEAGAGGYAEMPLLVAGAHAASAAGDAPAARGLALRARHWIDRQAKAWCDEQARARFLAHVAAQAAAIERLL